jgi:ABC-2 type transport system ATP-binding protein
MLTTHNLEEAERLADRVGILQGGKLVAHGSPDELMRQDRKTVRLRAAAFVDPHLLTSLPSVDAVKTAEDGSYLIVTSDAPRLLTEVTEQLWRESVPIVELRVGYSSLEEAFLHVTEEEEE